MRRLLRWAPRPIRRPGQLVFVVTLIVLSSAICIRAGVGIGVAPVALAGIGLSSVISALAMGVVLLWTSNYVQFRRRTTHREARRSSLPLRRP